MTKHTPAPWKRPNSPTQIYADKKHIATAHYAGNPSVDALEAEANARLIAAAPELLEALKISLHRADQARYHTAENIEPITAEWLDGIIEAARAAIAKAEGA